MTFNPSDAEGQYGVHAVPNCGPEASANVTFQPVMFWFFHADPGGANNQTAGVFCAPTIGIYDIEASLYLNTMALVNVTVLNDYAEANNVSGSPLDGQAFNGYVFRSLIGVECNPIHIPRPSQCHIRELFRPIRSGSRVCDSI